MQNVDQRAYPRLARHLSGRLHHRHCCHGRASAAGAVQAAGPAGYGGFKSHGGVGHNGSGDIFLAFSMDNQLPDKVGLVHNLEMVPLNHLNPFFEATAEAVEEVILDSLTAAETMVVYEERIFNELPLEDLQELMRKYHRLA